MPRILGIDIPNQKRIIIALTYIHGIGKKTAEDILKKANIDKSVRAKNLSEIETNNIRKIIEKDQSLIVEGELRRKTANNIKRKKDIMSYQGIRHIRRLPVRGQNTKSNARSKRGQRVAVGGTNPKAAAKK